MGKPTGFLEWNRVLPKREAVGQRLKHFREFYPPAAEGEITRQAGRCMDCGIPFCNQGCPLGNEIPDWNELVYSGRWHEAFLRLNATNNFPEFTGRLCPAPCEGACVLAVNDSPVTIEEIEKSIIERAFQEGWVIARPPRVRTGFHVAIVGSGPAGLAAAVQLNSVGHRVTVYEASDQVGGLLRYGIPDFKMEKWVLDRRIDIMRSEGIEFVVNAAVGEGGPTWAALQSQFDALLLAIGAGRPRDLDVPGRELEGVHFAMHFLEAQNRRVTGTGSTGSPLGASGRRVVILGGGDTGSDCLGTALRQGARSVEQIELMPQPPGYRSDENPWPQWPMILRTSSSQEEGGNRRFGLMTKRLVGEEGRLCRAEMVQVELRKDANGRDVLEEQDGTMFCIETDMLLLAMGFVAPRTEAVRNELGVEVDNRGAIRVDEHFATNVRGVFAAGDAHRGASLIVWAISEGREAARGIDRHLQGERSWLPTRGIDLHFGGR